MSIKNARFSLRTLLLTTVLGGALLGRLGAMIAEARNAARFKG